MALQPYRVLADRHNYILPISTVRIQLHVSVLYVDHFHVEILTYRSVIQDVWGVWVGGWLGVRDLVVSLVGYRNPELLEVNFL